MLRFYKISRLCRYHWKRGIRGERQGDFTYNSATLHVFEKMKSSPRDSTFQEEISIYIRVFLKVMPCWAWVSPLIWCLIPFFTVVCKVQQ
jgi:hypothetical protein